MSEEIKVILLGHGSSLPYARNNFEKLEKLISKKCSDYIFDIAFMSEGKDALNEKIYSNLSNNIKKIIVVPVFLSHGVHTKEDIPQMLGLGANNERDIHFEGRTIKLLYSEPLGIDQRIVDIVVERIHEAIK